jgi:uncharacterized protein (UPF0332 family)
VTSQHGAETAARRGRAEHSVEAARLLASRGYHDFAASRGYYAAFYAAKAGLLQEGLEFSKHSAVIAAVHQHYVKTGRLHSEQGKAPNWLFELRGVADYGGAVHVSQDQVQQAIEAAAAFLEAIKHLLR